MAQDHGHPHTPQAEEETTRFGVSMSSRLLERFDALIASQGYTNRSEAVRDLIRDRLVDVRARAEKGVIVGALTLVYDHEARTLGDRLTDLQHHMGHLVISTLHVHLSHRDCLEVVVLKGQGKEVRDLANQLLSLKGVKHGKLVITGSGEEAS